MAAKMGFGRFFAETWVGSNKPSFQPSDCMNASVDSSYLSGYNILIITAIFPLCPISAQAFSYTIAALMMGWTGRALTIHTPARLQHNSILTIIVIVVMIALL